MPKKTYFKSRIYVPDGTFRHVVVWDGEKDWKSLPPLERLAAAGELRGPKIGVIQVKDVETFQKRYTVEAALAFDSLVYWSKDHRSYRKIIELHKDCPRMQ